MVQRHGEGELAREQRRQHLRRVFRGPRLRQIARAHQRRQREQRVPLLGTARAVGDQGIEQRLPRPRRALDADLRPEPFAEVDGEAQEHRPGREAGELARHVVRVLRAAHRVNDRRDLRGRQVVDADPDLPRRAAEHQPGLEDARVPRQHRQTLVERRRGGAGERRPEERGEALVQNRARGRLRVVRPLLGVPDARSEKEARRLGRRVHAQADVVLEPDVVSARMQRRRRLVPALAEAGDRRPRRGEAHGGIASGEDIAAAGGDVRREEDVGARARIAEGPLEAEQREHRPGNRADGAAHAIDAFRRDQPGRERRDQAGHVIRERGAPHGGECGAGLGPPHGEPQLLLQVGP